MSMQQFCLRWNNHQPNFISVFTTLLNNESLVDVTLAAEGRHLQAHKVVLSACSVYFQTLFTANPSRHPIVILKDVKYTDLRTMVDFMYYGEVNVSQDQLPQVLETAKMLKIKGLTEMPDATFTKSTSTDRADLVPTGDHSAWGEQQKGNLPCNMSPSVKRKRRKASTCNSVLTMSQRTLDDKVNTNPDTPTTCSSVNLVKTESITVSSVSSVPAAMKAKQQMLTVKDSQFMMMQQQKHSLEDTGIELVMPESDDAPSDCILHNVDNPMVTESASDMTMQVVNAKPETLQRQVRVMINRSNYKKCTSMNDSIACTANRHGNNPQHTQQSNPLHNQSSSRILYDMPVIESVESLQHKETKSTVETLLSPHLFKPNSSLESTKKRLAPEMFRHKSSRSILKQKSSPLILEEKSSPPLAMRKSDESLNLPIISHSPRLPIDAIVSENKDEPAIQERFEFVCVPYLTSCQPDVEKATMINQLSITDIKLDNCDEPNSPNVSESKMFSGKSGNSQSCPRTSPEMMPAPRLCPSTRVRRIPYTIPRPVKNVVQAHLAHDASLVPGIIRLRRSNLTFRTPSPDEMQTGPNDISEPTVGKSDSQENVAMEPNVSDTPSPRITEIQQISESERKEHCPATRNGPPLSCNFCWNTVGADGRTLRRKTKYHCPECKTNLCIVPCFHQFHDMNGSR